MEHRLVHHFLEHSTGRYPNRIALVLGDQFDTYAQLNSQANQLAAFLNNRGILSGDRVALLFENCPEYVISYYGIMKAGAVAAPLSTGLKAGSLRVLLEDLQPSLIIASNRFERMLHSAGLGDYALELLIKNPALDWSGQPIEATPWNAIFSTGDTGDTDRGTLETDLANIIYTSGSTGRPKGVMLTHRNITANTASICDYLKITDSDVQMVVLPFFYVMGASLLNSHFAAGGRVVINNAFMYPSTVLNQMVKERVTAFSGVPSTFAHLVHHSPLAKYADRLSSLRYVSQAGGHMSRRIKKQLREVLPAHTDIVVMYGATEASARLSYLEPGRFEDKMDSIGRPIPGVSFKILDEHMREVPPGQTGELVAAGDNIMQGYWNNPEATARALSPHGYHTGDRGYRDEDGFYHLVGRHDNMLKVNGHRINPAEIEDVIMDTGLAMETAVVGVPDPLAGHVLTALVAVRDSECTEKELLARCAEKLPRFKLPSRIMFVPSLPKSESGKIDSARCKELAVTGDTSDIIGP